MTTMSNPKLKSKPTDHQRFCQVQNIQVLLSEVGRSLEDVTRGGLLPLANLRDMQRRLLLANSMMRDLYSDLNEGLQP